MFWEAHRTMLERWCIGNVDKKQSRKVLYPITYLSVTDHPSYIRSEHNVLRNSTQIGDEASFSNLVTPWTTAEVFLSVAAFGGWTWDWVLSAICPTEVSSNIFPYLIRFSLSIIATVRLFYTIRTTHSTAVDADASSIGGRSKSIFTVLLTRWY